MNAFVFPGQGSQYTGMGMDLYESNSIARDLFEHANSILGFRISDTMFRGTDDELKQTRITQPAIYIHSVILFKTKAAGRHVDMVAGHSLGEFSALAAANAITFEDGLRLVYQRAMAMQSACELQPSTMAAVLGVTDVLIEEICANIDDIVVPANYNCPGQVVISGSVRGIELAAEALKAAGAKRVLVLNVAGAFHSPLMEPARQQLARAIDTTSINTPICPVYQNVNAAPVINPLDIKANLVAQLTAPVRWTQTIEAMKVDGATNFTECGPGKVLQGLIKKIAPDANIIDL